MSRVRERIAAVRRGADALPSPNIWRWPAVYEVENRAQDVTGAVWRALAGRVDWTGGHVVDVGCGSGFHLPRFAETARRVTGVEPHEPLVRLAATRMADNSAVTVVAGSAQRIPLPDASADVVHARTAYFFGPGCEPGLAEADRVLMPGGTLAVVDLDVRHRPYGDWMRAELPSYDADATDRFFANHGFDCDRVEALWRFESHDDLAAVLGIEFSAAVAARAVAEVVGLSFPVGYRVLTRRRPTGLIIA